MVLAGNLTDVRLLFNVLDALEDIFKLNAWFGWVHTDRSILLAFERLGGLDFLEELQKHPQMDIYKRSGDIMKRYFE